MGRFTPINGCIARSWRPGLSVFRGVILGGSSIWLILLIFLSNCLSLGRSALMALIFFHYLTSACSYCFPPNRAPFRYMSGMTDFLYPTACSSSPLLGFLTGKCDLSYPCEPVSCMAAASPLMCLSLINNNKLKCSTKLN